MQTSLLSNVTATGDDRQTNRNEVKQTAEQGSKQADCIEADVQIAEKQTTVPGVLLYKSDRDACRLA